METICVKLENEFFTDIKKVMKKHRYTTKTEFVREAIRDKLKDLEREEAVMRVKRIYGASKRKTADKVLHNARERAFLDLESDIK